MCLTYQNRFDNIINGSLVKRLRRRPLTAETRVRFPYGLLKDFSKGKSFFCLSEEVKNGKTNDLRRKSRQKNRNF